MAQCNTACTAQTSCTGFEYQEYNGKCEIHISPDDFHHTQVSSNGVCRCFEKVTGPPPPPTTSAAPVTTTTAAPVVTTTAPPVAMGTYVKATLSISSSSTKASLPNGYAEAQGLAKNGALYVFGGFEGGWTWMSKKSYR
jgi:hypothetical protein